MKNVFQTLGWAVYLACSWTWCIGMFLPVLMVRDFGFLGWVAFAVPNVIGAAALGWVLSRPGSVERIVSQHAAACRAFSALTIAFHCFFIGWLVRSMVGWAGPAIAGALVAGCVLFMIGGKRERSAASVVYAVSISLMLTALIRHGIPATAYPPTVRQPMNLVGLSPVVVFGFLLCPYLDLTFLRARALTSPMAGIAAFTLGFGLLFVVMILFTLWYTPLLQSEQFDEAPRVLIWIIAIHMIFQTGFTIALHLRPIAAAQTPPSFKYAAVSLFLISLLIGAFGIRWGAGGRIGEALRGETVYRLFMAFYGLIFPCYVWLCMVPVRRGGKIPKLRKLVVLAFTIAVVSPMFYLGIIRNRMGWLLPGFAIIIASRMLLRPFSFPGTATSTTPQAPSR